MPLSHCDTWIVDRQWAYSVQRVPDCLGGLSRVGISSRSTRPWNGQPPSIYYKRGDPYLCSAKAPVLEGSGSRHPYRRKGTSIGRISVHVSISDFFTIHQKRIRGGSTYAECNSGALKQHNATGATPPLSHCHAWLGATQ